MLLRAQEQKTRLEKSWIMLTDLQIVEEGTKKGPGRQAGRRGFAV